MHMLRCLFFIEGSYGFKLSSSYIPIRVNHLADDLLHNNLSSCQRSLESASFQPQYRPATGSSPQPSNGLDITRLDLALGGYFHSILAPSMHRSYNCALRCFNSFYVEYSMFDPFPVNEKLLCYFATKLANDGLAPQTSKDYG